MRSIVLLYCHIAYTPCDYFMKQIASIIKLLSLSLLVVLLATVLAAITVFTQTDTKASEHKALLPLTITSPLPLPAQTMTVLNQPITHEVVPRRIADTK